MIRPGDETTLLVALMIRAAFHEAKRCPPTLREAITLARQIRFEHGLESGIMRAMPMPFMTLDDLLLRVERQVRL